MTKKLSSLVVLVAAMLLSVPVQAQTAVKKSQADKAHFTTKVVSAKDLNAGKAAFEKAQDQTVAVPFRAQQNVTTAAEKSAAEQRALKEADARTAYIWNWSKRSVSNFVWNGASAKADVRHPFAKFNGRQVDNFRSLEGQAQVPLRAATVDANGIITAPDEGEHKFYTRAGSAYYVSGGSVYSADQSGHVEVVECADDVVYIKDIVSRNSQGTWVKGTKAGNTITVAGAQPVSYNAGYDATLSVNWGDINEAGNGYNRGSGDITFTVDEAAGTITLDGSSQQKVVGVFWDDDNSWSGYADYSTVWTLDTEYEPASTDLIVLPDGAPVEQWYAQGTGSSAVPGNVNVAFVENEVYISGLIANFPDSWIKGTIDGTTVTFSGLQFLGTYSSFNIWAVGADAESGTLLPAFTMTYDADAKTLTLDAGQFVVFNAAEDRMYYLAYIDALSLSAEKPQPKQVDVPYTNNFDDAEAQSEFAIIDANGDGSSWAFYSGMVRYTYNADNAGDDWLVSPAVKLVAGKKYHFSIGTHAQSSSYPERLEVKAAKENTAEALAAGVEVIPPTDVTSASFITLENGEFTVTEDGDYFIGVHAISNADEYYLYVDDFVIEGQPITAPYTADFSTEAPMADFMILDANGDANTDGNGTWLWSSTNGAYYRYSSSNAADDYLILPIKLQGGKNYDVTANVSSNGSYYPEKFEIVWGTAPTAEAMTNVIVEQTTVQSDVFTDYSGSFTAETDGTYYVAIHCVSDADQFLFRVMKFSVEVAAEGTAPAAVSDFTVTQVPDALQAAIAFNAPTTSIDGEPLTENLTKIDVVRNGEVVASFEDVAPGSAINHTDDVPANGKYSYLVIPYNASGIGEKSAVVELMITTAVDVPYTFDLTVQTAIDMCTVIDNNGDNSTWGWSSSYGTYYKYNSTNDGDDYLILLPVNMAEGKTYNITATAAAYSDSYPERFEVLVGTAPTVEALTTKALAPTDVTSEEFTDFEGSFTAPASGQYYVAVHAISPADSYYLQLQKVTVEAAAEPTAPAAASDFTATAGAEGALEVNLAFTAPTTAVDGSDLAGTVDVKVYRDYVLVNTITDVAVGSAQTWQDTAVENCATYTYYLVAANASGDGLKTEKQSVYVGEDHLGNVQNVQVAGTTANSFTLTWDQVAGANGGYLNMEGVSYEVWALEIEDFLGFQFLNEAEKVATTTDLTATVDLPMDEGDATYHYYGVKAVKGEEAGDATAAGSYTYVLTGAPTPLPVIEGFAGKTLHYSWDTNGGLGVDTDASDDDGVSLRLYNNGTSAEVYFVLTKVDLKNTANPSIVFDAKTGANVDKVKVVGSADGAPYEVLGEFDVTDDFSAVKQVLTGIVGTRFSSVGIQATIPTASVEQYEDYVIIDNIRIVDLYQYDLSVNVKAPTAVNAGETAAINVTVNNEGEEDASDFTVTVKAGEEVLKTFTPAEALPAFKKTTFDAELPTTIFDDAKDVTISVEIDYLNDLNEDNNVAQTIVSVKESKLSQPENVAAEQNEEGGINVSWTAPSNATSEVTEDVESYEEFATGGLGEEVHTGKIGEWTVYDGNGTYCYGFQGIEVPNLGAKNAWIVMAPSSTQLAQDLSTNYPAHSGKQYFISVCTAEPEGAIAATDHWLISPELPGMAQTISFYARELVDSYGPETIEILASSTDANPASFTSVKTESISVVEWTEFTAELPEGTKYFAIRHTSTDVFGAMVDDIAYLAGGSEATGFNIYYEGEQVASVTGEETTYTIAADKIEGSGEKEVAVSAVYANGESKPVVVKVNVIVSAIDALNMTGGKAFDVYTFDGKLVRQQTKSLNGLKGAYVINGKAVLVK